MATILIYPGQLGERAALVDVLRAAHDAAAEARAKEIAERQANGSPLDDETRWRDVSAHVSEMQTAMTARKSSDVAALAGKIVAATAGNEMTPLPPFSAPEVAEGVSVVLRMVSDADRRLWRARELAAWQHRRAAIERNDAEDAARAIDEIEAARADVVCGVVASLGGVQGLKESIRDSVPGLAIVGLLGPLYEAARYFLELPPGKALRCGLPSPST